MIEIKNRYTGKIIKTVDSENLRGANLSGANLRGADLSRADLGWADLVGADLRGADLSRADLSEADLSGANLVGANLSGANLVGADLSGANLSGADLSRADLSEANLVGAIFDAPILRLESGIYSICFNGTHLQIGCKKYTPDEWENFDDETISKMDSKALAFWREHKEPLLMLCRNLIMSRKPSQSI